ncbi:hypothetical protein ACROYT_G033266 [Oculina patagonica]
MCPRPQFVGPSIGTMLLVVVDTHSKWPEVVPMTTRSAIRTMEKMTKLFATRGSPEQLVSDNGRQFITDELRARMKSNEEFDCKKIIGQQVKMNSLVFLMILLFAIPCADLRDGKRRRYAGWIICFIHFHEMFSFLFNNWKLAESIGFAVEMASVLMCIGAVMDGITVVIIQRNSAV